MEFESMMGPGLPLMRLTGLWQMGRQGGGVSRGLRLATIVLSVLLVVAGSTLHLVFDTPDQFEDITLCGFNIDIVSLDLLKGVLFVVQGAPLRELVQLLCDARAGFTFADINHAIRGRYEAVADRMRILLQATVVLPLVGWLSAPLMSRLAAGAGGSRAPRQLPVPAWLPVDIHATPTYELLYALQAFGCTAAGAFSICVDAFFIRLMLLISAEIEVLCENISAIGVPHPAQGSGGCICRCQPNAADLACTCKGCVKAFTSSPEEASDEMYQLLVKAVRHHQTIIRMVALLQQTMDALVFIVLFANMANLCCSLFATAILLQRGGSLTKTLKGLSAVPVVLYQTSLYCLFGHIVTDQSEKLYNAAISCGWVNCDARFKRSLLIFMVEAMKPLEITVGKFCKLSRQMLLQVFHSSYALMNLLYYYHYNTE
uniref:Odorant receptor n=1 Tax=Locusta migratoria TaxID=7004 RepID=A0A0M4JMF9_LOCMI|nr:odorant receptor 126 [Locusta migratoria]